MIASLFFIFIWFSKFVQLQKTTNISMKRVLVLLLASVTFFSYSQEIESLKLEISKLQEDNLDLNHRLDQLQKMVDDVLWFSKLENVAYIDKVYLYGPAPAKVKNPTAMGANNPLKFWAYIFIPKNTDLAKK